MAPWKSALKAYVVVPSGHEEPGKVDWDTAEPVTFVDPLPLEDILDLVIKASGLKSFVPGFDIYSKAMKALLTAGIRRQRRRRR